MKIVKLRKNQTLFKEGFTHAFKFNGWTVECGAVVSALNKIYDNRQWRGKYWAWKVADGTYKRLPNGNWFRPIYIAVRGEAITTQAMIMMDVTKMTD